MCRDLVGCERSQILGWVPMLRCQKIWIRSHFGGMCSGFICFHLFLVCLYLSIYFATSVPTHSLTCQPTYLPTQLIYPPVCPPMYLYLSSETHFWKHRELPQIRENPLCVCVPPSKKKYVGILKPPLAAQQQCHFMFNRCLKNGTGHTTPKPLYTNTYLKD